MVDFQSRDTRRDGTTTDDEEDEPAEGEEATDSEAEDVGAAAAESTPEDPAADRSRGEHSHAHEEQPEGHDHGHAHEEQPEGHDHSHAHEEQPEGHDHSHGHHAHDIDHLGIAVVTISSSRSVDEDPSGDLAIEAIRSAGHEVPTRELIDDDYDGIQTAVDALVGRGDVDVVVTSGGTGVTPDDVTIEAVEPLFDKDLPGFGELFRALSQAEIGTRVVGTRATAGVVEGVPVFCLPGSANAVELGIEEIVLEEAGHLAGLARRE